MSFERFLPFERFELRNDIYISGLVINKIDRVLFPKGNSDIRDDMNIKMFPSILIQYCI